MFVLTKQQVYIIERKKKRQLFYDPAVRSIINYSASANRSPRIFFFPQMSRKIIIAIGHELVKIKYQTRANFSEPS